MKAVVNDPVKIASLGIELLKSDLSVLGSRWIESRRNCAVIPLLVG
jgi:hypothetical protein